MMESMNDPAYICSSDLHIEYMNPAMIQRVGKDLTGQLCYRALHNLNQQCDWCVYERVHNGELFEHQILSPMDQRIYLVAHSPIRHADGSVSKMAVYRDVTELKQAEENAVEAEKRFRDLFESISDLIFTQDMEGRFLSFNPAMQKLFGYAEEEFLGRKASEFMKPELKSHYETDYLNMIKKRGYYEGISSYFINDCTGFSETITAEKAKLFGVKDFLIKPVVLSEIAKTVRRVLDGAAP